MSKSEKQLKRISKKKVSSTDFIDGANSIRSLYDSVLVGMLGKKLGIKVSKYLLSKGLKQKTKKKK